MLGPRSPQPSSPPGVHRSLKPQQRPRRPSHRAHPTAPVLPSAFRRILSHSEVLTLGRLLAADGARGSSPPMSRGDRHEPQSAEEARRPRRWGSPTRGPGGRHVGLRVLALPVPPPRRGQALKGPGSNREGRLGLRKPAPWGKLTQSHSRDFFFFKICFLVIRRGHANLCIVPISVYVLPKQTWEFKMYIYQVREVAQWVKALVPKPDILNSVPRTHKVEGAN